ncbi:PBP1A family penicillin-binding protein [Paenibacillus alkaliterrae]|uniref:transglycosylase domain-containing protein n=1 Tax=Paenibacillus alkaliterrae TaxID=320909 RepID=UPI001F298076|nr:PBP1A family penicillin-binding protein [Paenibacillus alkaliterrae]MCF2941896.1 PBP1A family penicillin-binding protein [Paenibacillus alkaliterrae]
MRKKKRLKWKRIRTKHILIFAAAMAAVMLLGGWGTFRLMVNAQDIALLDAPLPAATVLYDRNGKEATRISFNKIEEIGYADIPGHMIDAVVAVEDKRYFEHDGMDMRAIGRALVANFSAGGTVQGGSTITQQLAKNVFLSHERTWSRKWDEVLLAKKIEESYGKQDIMEMYLNQIYYGEGAWGIKRAAYTYFGKEAKELTVAEAALLAGLIKAPSALTPYKHLEKAKARRDVVLQLMKEQQQITGEVYAQALQEPIKLLSSKPNRVNDIHYPYYVDQIIREAMTLYGLTENEVLQGGLRIYTELDTGMQQAAEKVYAKEELFPQSAADQLIQSGSVLVDPRDGGIRALVGGRGEQPFRGFNRATQLKRQPGSTIKPVVVYTPALEQGYQPMDKLLDEPINIGGYEPRNADGRFHGEVTLYEALINSYNIPAVKLLNEMGIDKGIDAAARFGLPLSDGDRNLGLALGGLHEGVSPLHMAEAFGVFANNGIQMKAHAITRIESADGEVLAEYKAGAGKQVTEPAIAHTMTAMLQGVIREGTGEAAELAGRPFAGKSGTTQMPGTSGYGAKDNWFVGYTPQLVGTVWLGYDQSDSEHYLTTSSKAAAVVLKAVFEEALQGEPVMPFPAGTSIFEKKKNKENNNDHSDDDNDNDNDNDNNNDNNNDNDDEDDNGDKESEWKKEREERKERKEREKEDKKRERDRDRGRDRDDDNDDDDDDDDND